MISNSSTETPANGDEGRPSPSSPYEANSIRVLEGVDLIRARPTLFLDGLDADGLHRLAFEAIDNAIDEFRAGHGKEIFVRLSGDGSVEVSDDGRGIPTENHGDTGTPTPVFIMTTAFAGAKFEEGAYSSSGGLHGVGLKCINAFSDWVELISRRGGRAHRFKFIDGKFEEQDSQEDPKNGTTIRFSPKYQMFGGATFDHDRLDGRLSDAAHLNPGLRCVFESQGLKNEHYSEHGISGFLDAVGCSDVFSAKCVSPNLEIECHMGALSNGDTSSASYANGIPTPEGGSHVAGVKSGLAKAMAAYAGKRGLYKESDPAIGAGDTSEGCFLVVSLRMESPPFTSQKKTKLLAPEIESECSKLISEAYGEWLEASPARGKHVASRMMQAAKSREKLKALKARLRLASKSKKTSKPSSMLISPREAKELLLSVKDPHWRKLSSDGVDVLPMRMKSSPPPNRTSLEKLLKQPDYFALASALGAGVGSLDDDPEGGFKIETCRYGKIVVQPGESAGSKLSASFILSFIEHHLPGLIESERVFWNDYMGSPVSFGRITTAQCLKDEVGLSEDSAGDSTETADDEGDENEGEEVESGAEGESGAAEGQD